MYRKAERALSPRQAEIATLVKSGKTSRQIGEALFIEPRTVDSHIEAICNKLGVRTRVELVVALFGSDSGTQTVGSAGARTNLPLSRTPLISRGFDVSEIAGLLDKSRLVTVTGSGGVGKTRTALAVGDARLADGKAAVWLVELAPLAQGALVPAALARVLNVPETRDRTLLAGLIAHLKTKAALLIFDNCEHVIAEAAALVDALLRNCEHVRILATSRESLRIAGEQRYRLPSLGFPSAHDSRGLGAAAAADYGAVALFAQRANEVDRTFVLDDENAPIVGEICRQLDGIALGIELAAARVNVLPLPALSARLHQCLHILTGGNRTVLPRHRTMRALIDWSYDLLSPAEQRLFERLSVFAGGCTLAAASSVYAENSADEFEVLEVLTSLADKSLVVADVGTPEPRYRLLESSCQYAREKLLERGEATRIAHRHALTYAQLAERLESEHESVPDASWFERTGLERDNWRVALEWSLTRKGDVVLGQRLACFMRLMWTDSSIVEARRALEAARDLLDERTPAKVAAQLDFALAGSCYAFGEYEAALTAARRAIESNGRVGETVRAARAKALAGILLTVLGQFDEGDRASREALDEARALGKSALTGFALVARSVARSAAGDAAGMRENAGEAFALYRTSGAERYAATVASGLAEAEFLAGNTARAIELVSTSLVTLRKVGYTLYVPRALINLAAYLIAVERFEEAEVHAREAVDLALESQHRVDLLWALQRLAASAALSREPSDGAPLASAAQILGFVDASIKTLGTSREFTERQERDRLMLVLRRALSAGKLAELLAAGAAMTPDAAIRAVRALAPDAGEPRATWDATSDLWNGSS